MGPQRTLCLIAPSVTFVSADSIIHSPRGEARGAVLRRLYFSRCDAPMFLKRFSSNERGRERGIRDGKTAEISGYDPYTLVHKTSLIEYCTKWIFLNASESHIWSRWSRCGGGFEDSVPLSWQVGMGFEVSRNPRKFRISRIRKFALVIRNGRKSDKNIL